MDREKNWNLKRIAACVAIITIAHFALGTRTHSLHGAHILLATLYMFPILMGAQAFELAGGLVTALAVISIYFVHIQVTWSGQTMENADRYAMLGAFLFVGASSGVLARGAAARRRERNDVIMASARAETVQGLLGLVTALGEMEPAALNRANRVVRACEAIGARMGIEGAAMSELRLAALAHDVGRIGDVYRVPSDPLDRLERGVRMVRAIFGGESIARIIAAQHERPDGRGAPRGWTREETPLPARVLHVAIAFVERLEESALHGKEAASAALESLRPLVGSALDGDCFAALEAVVRDGYWSDVPERSVPQTLAGQRREGVDARA